MLIINLLPSTPCIPPHSYPPYLTQTLERSYLLRIDGKVVERPQQMLMRVAVGIHKDDIDAAIETYNLLSDRWFTHASPTLFNAGMSTMRGGWASCVGDVGWEMYSLV